MLKQSRFKQICLAAILMVVAGCSQGSSGTAGTEDASPSTEAVVVDREPGQVELVSATAVLDEERIVRFEIRYRFVSGEPVKHYLVDIAFPGTDQYGIKPIDFGSLKSEGVIKTGIEVGDKPVKDFEITFSEADSPDQGFQLISNTLQGTIEVPPVGDSAAG